MASPSARTGLLLGSTNDIRLAPPACSTAPKRPRIDVSLAQRGPWSPGRHVPRKVAILLPREVGILSPLGYIPKWPFGAFAMQSRCPTHPARPPSHVGGPHCAPRPSFCDVGWLPRSTTARVPPCPTRLHPWDHGCKLFALAPTGHGLRRRATASPLTCQTGPRAVGRPVVPQISMVWERGRASKSCAQSSSPSLGRLPQRRASLRGSPSSRRRWRGASLVSAVSLLPRQVS